MDAEQWARLEGFVQACGRLRVGSDVRDLLAAYEAGQEEQRRLEGLLDLAMEATRAMVVAAVATAARIAELDGCCPLECCGPIARPAGEAAHE